MGMLEWSQLNLSNPGWMGSQRASWLGTIGNSLWIHKVPARAFISIYLDYSLPDCLRVTRLQNPLRHNTWLRLSDICFCVQKLIPREQEKVGSSQTATTKGRVLLSSPAGAAGQTRRQWWFCFLQKNPQQCLSFNLQSLSLQLQTQYKFLPFKCLIYSLVKPARSWQVRGIHGRLMHFRCPACLHRMVNQNKEGNEALMRDLHPGGDHY